MKQAIVLVFLAVLFICCTPGAKPENGSLYFDLRNYFNSDGISFNGKRTDGNLDVPANPYGSSFPAESLPAGNSIVPVSGTGGLMVVFPPKKDGEVNNITCEKQILEGFSKQAYSSIYFIGCGTNGAQEEVFKFRYLDGTIEEKKLAFLDWCAEKVPIEQVVAFSSDHRHNFKGEDEDVRCGLYAVRAEVTQGKTLVAIQLPDNSDIHIFAVSGMVRIR